MYDYMETFVCLYVYIYIYIYMCLCTHVWYLSIGVQLENRDIE